MPYSDVIPPLILPDCDDAKDEVRRDSTYAEFGVVFCHHFKPYGYRPCGIQAIWRDTCANRTLAGDRDHNWCTHCPAGYPFFTAKESEDLFGEQENRRLKPVHLGY